MHGTVYVEWDDSARPPKPRYYGWGYIDGIAVKISGDLEIEANGVHKRARFVIRPRHPEAAHETDDMF